MFSFIFPKFLATWIILSCQGWLNTEEKHSGETEYNSAQDYNHKSTSWSKSQIATYQKESTWGTLSNKNTRKCGNFLPIYPLFFGHFAAVSPFPHFPVFRFKNHPFNTSDAWNGILDTFDGTDFLIILGHGFHDIEIKWNEMWDMHVKEADRNWHIPCPGKHQRGRVCSDVRSLPTVKESDWGNSETPGRFDWLQLTSGQWFRRSPNCTFLPWKITINVNFSTILSNTWHRHPCQCIRLPSQNGVDAEETLRMEERRPTTTTGPFFSLTSAASLGTEWSWWRRQSWCLRWEAPEDWLWCRGSVAAAGSPSTPSLYKRSRVK